MGIKYRSRSISPDLSPLAVASSNILCHYKMNEGTGNDIADSGGNDLGTITNSRSGGSSSGFWSPDGVANFILDTNPDYFANDNLSSSVQIPSFDTDNCAIIMYRLRSDATLSNNATLFNLDKAAVQSDPLIRAQLLTVSGQIRFMIDDATSNTNMDYAVNVCDGVERHFAFVYELSGTNITCYLYVNGELKSLSANTKSITKPSIAIGELMIGMRADNSTFPLSDANPTTYNEFYDFQIVTKASTLNTKYANGIRYVAAEPYRQMPAEFWD